MNKNHALETNLKGFMAARRGRARSTNPYNKVGQSHSFYEWECGWMDGNASMASDNLYVNAEDISPEPQPDMGVAGPVGCVALIVVGGWLAYGLWKGVMWVVGVLYG